MKQIMKKATTIMLSALLVLSMIVVPAIPIHAEDDNKPYIDTGDFSVLFCDDYKNVTAAVFKNFDKNKKITVKVKSSNKAVATAKYDAENQVVIAKVKSVGTTTFTYKVKQNGKTYTTKNTITVLEYTNPFKSFKIGGKEYKKLFKNNIYVTYHPTKNKQKLSIKVKKGFKIQDISAHYEDWSIKHFKNGSKVNFKNMRVMYITLKDKADTGEYVMKVYIDK